MTEPSIPPTHARGPCGCARDDDLHRGRPRRPVSGLALPVAQDLRRRRPSSAPASACWHRNTVAAICKLPPPDPELQAGQPQTKEPAATDRTAAPATSRHNRKERSTQRTVAVA